MRLSGNTVLITGGATGIGLGLAKEFAARGNTVIICGRREEKLGQARQDTPALMTFRCDISIPEERRALFRFCAKHHPGINVLVNNAGIQREVDFRKGEASYLAAESEVSINLDAPLHLASLFIPYFLQRGTDAAVVNVSSGLGLVPLTLAPVYSATKAALHSASQSMRAQLAGTPVRVFEILPPVVDTDLDRGARARRGQTDRGISVGQVAAESIAGMEKDRFEIAVGMVKALRIGSRIAPGFFSGLLNRKVPYRP